MRVKKCLGVIFYFNVTAWAFEIILLKASKLYQVLLREVIIRQGWNRAFGDFVGSKP